MTKDYTLNLLEGLRGVREHNVQSPPLAARFKQKGAVMPPQHPGTGWQAQSPVDGADLRKT